MHVLSWYCYIALADLGENTNARIVELQRCMALGISREKAVSMGINGFLIKPVQLFDLAKMIRKVIDGNSY